MVYHKYIVGQMCLGFPITLYQSIYWSNYFIHVVLNLSKCHKTTRNCTLITIFHLVPKHPQTWEWALDKPGECSFSDREICCQTYFALQLWICSPRYRQLVTETLVWHHKRYSKCNASVCIKGSFNSVSQSWYVLPYIGAFFNNYTV